MRFLFGSVARRKDLEKHSNSSTELVSSCCANETLKPIIKISPKTKRKRREAKNFLFVGQHAGEREINPRLSINSKNKLSWRASEQGTEEIRWNSKCGKFRLGSLLLNGSRKCCFWK